MEDRQIVELYWQRDENAIRQSEEKYGHDCFRVAYRVLYDRDDAQECVNDTWLTAWQKIPPERPNILKYFLLKITRLLSINRLRVNTAEKRGGNAYDVTLNELENVLSDSTTPEQEVNAEILKEAIQSFLKGQKAEARKIFVRRYFFFETTKEIAEMYGISENKVSVTLNRTRNKLREYLGKEGYM